MGREMNIELSQEEIAVLLKPTNMENVFAAVDMYLRDYYNTPGLKDIRKKNIQYIGSKCLPNCRELQQVLDRIRQRIKEQT